jgi:SSS family solute:Na+ symporter/sodium/pantothenate symporter
MDKLTLAWIVFGVYVVLTAALAWRGMKKTSDLEGFALGKRDMGPTLVGMALAASIASSATFIINPGFVYAHGLSALLHLGVSATAGITLGLVLMSKGFRKYGKATSALTLPHWIGARYQNGAMRTYFALLNLLLAITFVVLIIKGSAVVMQHTLGMSYPVSVTIIVGFVFTYILLGGTYAHAYTNAFQGLLMTVVAMALVGSGLYLLGDGLGAFVDQLATQDADLVRVYNPGSALYEDVWDVFVCPFVVGFGLVCQPHILLKSLYLERDRDVNRYLWTAVIIGLVFAAILLVGLWARVAYPGIPSQDAVVAVYIQQAFGDAMAVLISVALLAAGMSTMDGILVGASSIAGNDLFLGALGKRLMPDRSKQARERAALAASRWILVGIGVISFGLAIKPPEFVGLFAQMGVYGLVAASLAPVAVGIFVKQVDTRDAFVASVVGPLVHFGHYLPVVYIQGETLNPAVSATEGVAASLLILGVATLIRRRRRPAVAAETTGDAPTGSSR